MNSSAIIWEGPLSRQEVALQLTQALFGSLTKPGSLEEALRAEVLRVAIWEQSILNQPQTLTDAGVSTQKILRRARLLWHPIHPDFKKDDSSDDALVEDTLNRRALENLAEQGDFFFLSGGQWIPAPLRLVPIAAERYLLVGGIPASLLTSGIFQHLSLHGTFRQLDADLIQKYPPLAGNAAHWQFQTQESWLGAPPPSFKELFQQFWDIALLPQTTLYAAEVYVASRDKAQSQRWQPLEKVYKAGRYLLRSQKPWGQRFYTIGHVENGHVTQQSQTLESWDIRRLCYALDDEAQVPTRVSWNKREGVLTLQSELPGRERKHLAVLGSLQPNGTDFYYPRLWRISPRYEQNIQKMLEALSIMIQ